MSSVGDVFLAAVDRHKAGAFSEAQELYRRVLRVDPRHADSLHLLGVTLHQQGQHAQAVDFIEQAIAVNARSAVYFSNLGAAQRALGRWHLAEASYRRSVALQPAYAEAHYNLGNVLLEQCRIPEATSAFEQAVALKPEFADAQHNLAAARRMTGDFARGWDGYEWRFRCDIQERLLPWPVWDGASLAGKTLLVHAEQGVGDEIMFGSCLPDAIKAAKRCVFECDRRLAPLFARSFPNVEIVARRDDFRLLPNDLPVAADVRISTGSLPRFFRRDEAAFPFQDRYLVPDKTMTNRWRTRLAELGLGIKVGISWRGGKSADVRARRSTTLAQWKPVLAIEGMQFVSLQYDDTLEERQQAAKELGVTIHDFVDIDRRNDLDQLAAQIAALDLVISVDNSTVHLAGALGVPTMVLLPFASDWRWMVGRDDSLWYSSVWLIRQSRPGDWSGVFERVSAMSLFSQ